LRDYSLRLRIEGLGIAFRVEGLGLMVDGLGLR